MTAGDDALCTCSQCGDRVPVAELAGHVERHAGAGARWSAERLIDLSHLLLEVSLVDPCGACDGARAVRLLPGRALRCRRRRGSVRAAVRSCSTCRARIRGGDDG